MVFVVEGIRDRTLNMSKFAHTHTSQGTEYTRLVQYIVDCALWFHPILRQNIF